MQRKSAEKELLMEIARGQFGSAEVPWSHLCRLQRQIVILRHLPSFSPAAMAVGLAERRQKYQHQA